ncbi:hypothetical protein D3C87_299130 [compost metagenome]
MPGKLSGAKRSSPFPQSMNYCFFEIEEKGCSVFNGFSVPAISPVFSISSGHKEALQKISYGKPSDNICRAEIGAARLQKWAAAHMAFSFFQPAAMGEMIVFTFPITPLAFH